MVNLLKTSHAKHKLDHEDDYIANPKKSGYRGVHLIYRYFSDRKETYNTLKIEMQLRSRLQHAWATAVETVGAFTQHAFKSSHGPQDWLRFFVLMASDIAIRERANPVPDTPTSKNALKKELRAYAKKLDVEGHLRAYGAALQETESAAPGAHYFLLQLDPNTKHLNIQGYTFAELDKAAEEYTRAERGIGQSGSDTVLVSVESLDALCSAYPNYFLDTHVFLSAVTQAIK